jgi:hypothetical protein
MQSVRAVAGDGTETAFTATGKWNTAAGAEEKGSDPIFAAVMRA